MKFQNISKKVTYTIDCPVIQLFKLQWSYSAFFATFFKRSFFTCWQKYCTPANQKIECEKSYSGHWYSSQSFRKKNVEFFAEQSVQNFCWKFANVTLVFKQGSRNLKGNCRSSSILPMISKTFKKLVSG